MAAPPSLNLNDSDIEHAGELLVQFLRDYERAIPAPRIVPELDRKVLTDLLTQPFPRWGIGIDALFREIGEKIAPNSTAIAHPRFLAYVLGPSNGIAPFAEAIAAALNQNCNFWQLSPAASVIERKLMSWIGSLFGYPESAGGLVTSGGSMATLVALSAALHDKCGADFRRTGLQGLPKPLVVYTSAEAHRCVEKDAAILGIGLDHVRKVPVDADFRVRVDLLERAVVEDRKAGKQPFCVVAAGGTINTGAVDPIDAIADFCERENLWLHVDGAYGALFVISERKRDLLRPCGRADSIALDPHKLLFAPLEAGCVLVRKPEKLRRAFGFDSSYLTADTDPLLTNFMDYGPQLSRSFKAFKVWCALQTFGVDAFVQAVDHQLDMAAYFGERIAAQPDFELMAPVALSAVCFRLKHGDDSANHRVLTALTEEGTALLGPVTLDGRSGLRACVTNYRTTREDLDLVVERLVALAAQL
jgi:aromatic-L-amino-acid/L-tryptophan decarboxylase